MLYPKMVMQDCCGTNELARMIAGETTFSTERYGESSASLPRENGQRNGWRTRGETLRNRHVHPSLTLKKGKERETPDGEGTRRNAESIEIRSVNFRPAKELVQETSLHCRLERAPKKSKLHVSEYTPEQRLDMAKRFLSEHAMMTVSDYARLVGLSRTTASKEVREWLETNRKDIEPKGKAPTGFM